LANECILKLALEYRVNQVISSDSSIAHERTDTVEV